MGKSADQLVNKMQDRTGFDQSPEELRDVQLAALNERLQENIDRIKLVKHRAGEAGITEIQSFDDVVPLLLPHTAYKSYPESFLVNKRWDRLTKWLGTVSSADVSKIDLDGVESMDEWVEACGKAGVMVSCSSGTTGSPAMLPATQEDLDFTAADVINGIEWGSKMRRGDKRKAISYGAVALTPRNTATGVGMMSAFADMTRMMPQSDIPPITIGSITDMIALRKAMTEGTAKPDEIAAFEKESARRQKALDDAVGIAAQEAIDHRDEPLCITGMWASLYQLAVAVRELGYSGKDFHPENSVFLSGGLKRAQLPDNFKEFVFETFNLSSEYIYNAYGMQEIQTSMPRCQEGGRYHVPAWLVCLPLDKDGSNLLPTDQGPVQARAAFFDLSLQGRWGGVISGDRIDVDFSPCKCGSPSPSIGDEIVRYADIEGDDKIGCAGTVDAYVRGVS